MMWWHGDLSGWDWAWMSIGMVAFWVVIGLVIYWIVRSAQGSSERGRDATEILEERFARGEISVEEFEERKTVLTTPRR